MRHTPALLRENPWFSPLITELTVTNLAHFTGLAVLVVHLAHALQFTAFQQAVVLVLSSIGLRFSRVVLAPVVDRVPARRAVPCAILLSMAGYIGLAFATSMPAVGLCVLIIGTGYGINGMLVTTLASYTHNAGRGTFPIYALMNIATNIAASIAPLISNALRLHATPSAPFLFAALMLVGSFLIALRIAPETPAISPTARFSTAVGPLLRDRRYLAVLALVMGGWVVYTQKFSATPLFLDAGLGKPGWVGLAIAVNAAIILLVSIPAARWVRARGTPGRRIVRVAFGLYLASYALLALRPTVTGLWIALALWSVGEALLMPQLNALIAEYTADAHRLAGFSLSAIAIGLGEGGGNALGAAMMGGALTHGHPGFAYAFLALLAAGGLAGALLLRPAHAEITV